VGSRRAGAARPRTPDSKNKYYSKYVKIYIAYPQTEILDTRLCKGKGSRFI